MAFVLMGYGVPRTHFILQLNLYVILFGIYSWAFIWKPKPLELTSGLALAFGLRLLLLLATPELSDDFYRFLFDGHLIGKGVNPYSYLPAEAMGKLGLDVSEFWNTLFLNMNSQAYYSIYTPLNQFVFWLASLTGENLLANIVSLRVLLLVFEGLNFYFLYRIIVLLHLPINRLWLYAFNPLVILEITGNLHFEGMLLTGLLAAIYFYIRVAAGMSAMGWAFAVAVKLNPLLLGPFIVRIWKGNLRFLTVAGMLILVLLLPLVWEGNHKNFWDSFRLYQSTFEFNASIYYLLRSIGQILLGYNPIGTLGPMLNLLAFLLIITFSIWSKVKDNQDVISSMVWLYFIYLILQTTVHPWYILPALGLSILTANRLFLLWSATIFLSYSAYADPNVTEIGWLIVVQYGVVFGYAVWWFIRPRTTS